MTNFLRIANCLGRLGVGGILFCAIFMLTPASAQQYRLHSNETDRAIDQAMKAWQPAPMQAEPRNRFPAVSQAPVADANRNADPRLAQRRYFSPPSSRPERRQEELPRPIDSSRVQLPAPAKQIHPSGNRQETGQPSISNADLDAILNGLPNPARELQSSLQNQNRFAPPRLKRTTGEKTPATQASSRTESVPSPVGKSAPAEKSQPYILAEQPKLGEHFLHEKPQTGAGVFQVPLSQHDFSPDPIDPTLPFDSAAQMNVYQGKTLNANQRPLLEIGRPWYQLGELKPGFTFLGSKNLVTPQFLIFGDFRSAVSSAEQNADRQSFLSFELNLFFDLKITSTERIHFNMTPLDNGQNSKFLLDNDLSFDNQLNPDINFGYFEGDMGAIVGGFVGENLPFDAPFAIGFMPLLFQNGVWAEDAFVGVAATMPARNSRLLDISNMDLTFFYGWDEVTTPAFADDNVNIYGVAAFIEAMGGYIEADYAYLEDRNRARDQSYHNISIGYSRRYGRFISNSIRVISNAGQSTASGPNTADGTLVLIENSLTTSSPMTFVPYFNLFAGFDRPQSAARAAAAGGVLRNTGILFESDGMTNFPTLDASGNDTYGGAFGLNILSKDFSQQLILEAAVLQTHGRDSTRIARGNQYGLGFRYQLPLTNADILRFDGILGFYENDDDLNGLRVEWRHKW